MRINEHRNKAGNEVIKQKTQFRTIAVLGAGSWGTALTLHLSRIGWKVLLWTFEDFHVADMLREKTNNRFMPGFPFPENIVPVTELKQAMQCETILIAVPSHAFRETVTKIKPLVNTQRFVSASKGLDPESGEFLHHIFKDIIGDKNPFAVLSGPSFAREVAADLPTSVMIASSDPVFAKEIAEDFRAPTFRTFVTHDVIGTEVGGIVKNVLAIAVGISDGLGYGANARAALITQGLSEMMRLGHALGGEFTTFIGYSGLGDMILTCTDNQSRNRRFGLLLGTGKSIKDAEGEIGQVVEGVGNAYLAVKLAKKNSIDLPIVHMVWEVLQSKLAPKEAMQKLLGN